MSTELQLVVYVLAVVCFVLGAFEVRLPRHPFHFGWLGLALVTLVPLVAAFQAL
jgi:uncharacterized membrane protein